MGSFMKYFLDPRPSNEGYFEPYDYIDIENLNFDEFNNILIFDLIRVTVKPKIARYKTINYEKFPIYEGQSVSTKKLYSMNKTIKNLQKYLDNEF